MEDERTKGATQGTNTERQNKWKFILSLSPPPPLWLVTPLSNSKPENSNFWQKPNQIGGQTTMQGQLAGKATLFYLDGLLNCGWTGV